MRHIALGCFLIVLAMLPQSSLHAQDQRGKLNPDRQLQALNDMVDELKSPYTDANPDQRVTRGEGINQAFVALTGEAVNPLFGITALGMYNYIRADDAVRPLLPLHDQPVVWVPLLIIILLMLFNSTICEAIPFLKVPLNALGDIVNKAGAIAVLPLVVKMFADAVAEPAAELITAASGALFPVAYAAESSAAGFVWHSLGWAAGAVCGLAIYLAVWMTFNVIDVLILICPFPGIDALLKSFRLSIIALLTGVNHLSPVVATILAAVIVLISFFLAGWSFRLSMFGLLFSTDVIFRRRGDLSLPFVTVFASDELCRRAGVPMRTLGRLEKNAGGGLVFSYRPWLVRPRRVVPLGAAEEFSCGVGLLNPFLVADAAPDSPWLRMPPRYSGLNDALLEKLGLKRVVSCGMAGSLRTWLGQQFGKGATAQQPA